MYSEDDLLPISALQHLLFCERQCALIHVERLWAENRLTIEGQQLHKKAHGEKAGPRGGGMSETRGGVRTVRALPIRSLRLGIAGVADVVEFIARAPGVSSSEDSDAGVSGAEPDTASVPALTRVRKLASGATPLPIEYKRGKPKHLNWDRVQVCAQALCLEEMLGVQIPEAAIFYGAVRRRERVELITSLRQETEAAATRLRQLFDARETPPAKFERKCLRCSLINLCLPRVTAGSRSASAYIRRELRVVAATDGGAQAGGSP